MSWRVGPEEVGVKVASVYCSLPLRSLYLHGKMWWWRGRGDMRAYWVFLPPCFPLLTKCTIVFNDLEDGDIAEWLAVKSAVGGRAACLSKGLNGFVFSQQQPWIAFIFLCSATCTMAMNFQHRGRNKSKCWWAYWSVSSRAACRFGKD